MSGFVIENFITTVALLVLLHVFWSYAHNPAKPSGSFISDAIRNSFIDTNYSIETEVVTEYDVDLENEIARRDT